MPRFLSIAKAHASAPRPIHGVLTGVSRKRLSVAALPGIRPDGTWPEGLEPQAEQAFANLGALLLAGGLRVEDLVSVCAYVAAPGAKATIHRIATEQLGGFRPAAAVRQVVALSQAGSLVELDADALAED